ncbi:MULTISPECIES: DNA-directed RNA polymerase subunit omega [Dictyoglomus]|jgi:DNA-directed RNA polymerase subunit omega|uniref:DNA-directed RNA polymerase subunit omega n=1 Tax=Dictyoglomus turgidum (strain DSM 6724 / Z-1310) TaxID=515635 RepID=RPOZ_DICTD|nr:MULTISPECIES: DNA-directed RNA polymerase subunit omega [Dictyoglomus]B8E0X9.1 RecName: Full=DNA-directed RNA polymerase subunit omega; Short=RNAP omega subunit; AltName: Full=RNA polymerase omega subunit; AltName: Full=Transcriptase subunit omega [Dictyoglomus turgidum DSM 6724]ACK42716.1 DNA-directed RNA polymerase, omega subunit [Dictyoglomus turgidum DSM 6724]HBU30775.1 DNA-directed RNA polymerase subunit omega [Dictyoglomus sp.]
MKEVNIDTLISKIPNKYVLTVVISKRARQLFEELKFLKTIARDPLILAMEEIAQEKIAYGEGDDLED